MCAGKYIWLICARVPCMGYGEHNSWTGFGAVYVAMDMMKHQRAESWLKRAPMSGSWCDPHTPPAAVSLPLAFAVLYLLGNTKTKDMIPSMIHLTLIINIGTSIITMRIIYIKDRIHLLIKCKTGCGTLFPHPFFDWTPSRNIYNLSDL